MPRETEAHAKIISRDNLLCYCNFTLARNNEQKRFHVPPVFKSLRNSSKILQYNCNGTVLFLVPRAPVIVSRRFRDFVGFGVT